jgi:hypothetical protein
MDGGAESKSGTESRMEDGSSSPVTMSEAWCRRVAYSYVAYNQAR